MPLQTEKTRLWQTIRVNHPELARAFKERTDDHVAIDCYPVATNRWLMTAIEHANPALAALLIDTVLPDREYCATFCKPSVSVAVNDLISALLAYEGLAEAA